MLEKQNIRHAWQGSRLAALALLFVATTAFARNFAFPSPLPPMGGGPGTPGWSTGADSIKQIVSFIWDDNAYSGMIGTNYEGPNTVAGQFLTMNWIGGRRVEGDWATTGVNHLNIQAGEIGMSWAINTLSGHTAVQAMPWSSMADYRQGDQVTYEGYLWVARAWTGNGTVPVHNPNAESWAPGWNRVRELGSGTPSRTNPDGSRITQTFNVITGLFTPTAPFATYMSRESRYGWFRPNLEFFPQGTASTAMHDRIAVAWGREHAIYMTAAGIGTPSGRRGVIGYLEEVFKEAITLGHEVGNHTIDHMETNSPLPMRAGNMTAAYPAFADAPGTVNAAAFRDGFARWNGEGMARGGRRTGVTLPDGQEMMVDQVIFGQRPGNAWQYMGWEANAGRVLSVAGWRGLIQLGEEELLANIPELRGRVFAFRAPRLEVNTNLFHALRSLNYLYDTGNEEGYEYNMDGTNQVWPYTMDNGSPNMAWQRAVGANRSNWDSLPSGLWQFPVSVFIVPEQHRAGIFNNHVAISRGAADGVPPSEADRQQFLRVGKITGFDFNLFVLWGATREAAIATLRHSLDSRIRGGKAPFQIGSHTDYFTPIYDYATLLNEVNKEGYGLIVNNNWNTWRDRIATYEDIVTYGLQRGAYFWDGKKTIDYVISLAERVRVGATRTTVNNWTHFNHTQAGPVVTSTHAANSSLASGSEIRVVQTRTNEVPITTGFVATGLNFRADGFDHISLEYSISAPITIRLLVEGSAIDAAFPYEVTLSNLNGWNDWNDNSRVNRTRFVNSREIPLSAFQRGQYVSLSDNADWARRYTGLVPPTTEFSRTVTGIEIAVQKPIANQFQWRRNQNHFERLMNGVTNQNNFVAIRNFTIHSGEQTITPTNIVASNATHAPRTAVMGMTANKLNLSIARAGVYNVDIITANGRVVQSIRDVNLAAGVNGIPLNRMASGVYMIRIHNQNFNTTLRSVLR
jgi:peptidoglycan/xylan/chitin deacetylase (PgdA/CDA1 family)